MKQTPPKRPLNTSLQIRLASIAILGLLMALSAVAYYSGRRVERDSSLIAQDAVPGTIHAHYMRMAISRNVGWVLVAASAQTRESRDAGLKTVHEAEKTFVDELRQYQATIKLNPEADGALLAQVKEKSEVFFEKRRAFEALILSGDRSASAAFLERELIPAFQPAIKAAEDLITYNHANSIRFSTSIQRSVSDLYWAVAVVMGLALACTVVLVFNMTIRCRELGELQENAEKFSKAFKSNPSGIAITELGTGKFIEVNDSYCRIIGFSPEEVIGHTSLELGIWESSAARSRIFEPLYSGGSLRDIEMTAIMRGGGRRLVNVNADPIELGGKACVISSVADITERQELQRKQEQLAAIVEFSDDAIIGKTLEGIISSWNRGAERIFGYTAQEAIGQTLLILFPPDRIQEEKVILERISQGETVHHFETVRVRKDGRRISISATISPLRDEEGKVTGASKIARDITAQKKADEAVREGEARIRSLGDNLPSGMMYQLDMGADGLERRFTYVSAGVEKLHEVTAWEVLQDAQFIYGQVAEADRPLVVAREADALARMQPFMAELRMRMPSGAVRWSLFTSAPRRAANGHVLWDGIELDITAQKQAEEFLRQKQAQLIQAMEVAKLAHWEFDVAKNIVTADEYIFQMLGTASQSEGGLSMSPEEYIRKFVHPEDAWIITREVALGVAATDPSFSRQFEHRVIRRDGMERVMLVRCRIVMGEGGRTGKILGTNQDITEQKQVELRIRQLNRIHSVLSAINKTIVHEKEPKAMLTKACQIAVETGGFRMAWVGMHDATAHKVLPVASAGMVDGYLEQVNIDLNDKERSSGPTGRCFQSGEHSICNDIEHDVRMAPWREEMLGRGYHSSASFPLKTGGKVRGVFTLYSEESAFFNEEEMLLLDELAMDISFALEVGESEARRRQAEQELRWRTAFFEAQVHSAIDGILVLDSTGRKLLQNRRMNELWKIPPHIADDPDDAPQFQFVLGRVKEPEYFVQKTTHLNAHPDESSSDVIELVDGTILERYSAPVRGRDGTYYGRVWTFHDITGRKKLEKQFLRAQRMESIGTLASGVAHDLNNILTPIMMSVAVLRMGTSEDKRKSLCDTIEMSAQRGAQIIKQVLTFGRGYEGEKQPLRVGSLIHEIEQMIRSTFPKNISMETEIEPSLRLVLGDATQMHQVLLNLCVNARDAMPNGGKLILSAANLDIDLSYASMVPEVTPGAYVLLKVTDTGSGIPAEILERIFDPFFTTKGVGKGTGLGLSTVHGIVKSHGGILKVESEPGVGTIFNVYLPAAAKQDGAVEGGDAAEPPAGHGELVLVVDDEPAITSAARSVLEANGYRVLLASDGIEAIEIFSKNMGEIALVLTDVMMPVMDGVLFVRTLRKLCSKVRVIGSTGVAEKGHLGQLNALHVEHVLFKPYNAATLLRTIHGVLHQDA
ncbi:PAS domain S-box protein [Prosthecobacter sp.]|uniref:PAS domain S-box protein n=1 Tax=Prosthecobacter sp. TaxID=1965333 RepID=UPI00378300E1